MPADSGFGWTLMILHVNPPVQAAVLGIGFVAYGLSIYFYVYAQRLLGAARPIAYYAVAPFISAILSVIIS